MLMAGKCVYQRDDQMVKVQPEQLWHAIRNPKPQVESIIRQLRTLREIDQKAYQTLKKELPYVVAGIFHPTIRRTENFAWINHFILDIDHLSAKGIGIDALKDRLKEDKRVLLMFESPGQDGLKLFFRISEKIYDAGKYSLFYKAFATAFSVQNGLEQVIDPRTSDATRACFVSHDQDAYYNANAEPIDPASLIDFDNPFLVKELRAEIREHIKENTEGLVSPTAPDREIADETLVEIKKRLNPNYKSKKEKHYFVPPEAESLVSLVDEAMQKEGIQIKSCSNISYGKKFRFTMGIHEAEINVFYGKKGYSVVISPRSGTRPELNELCAQLINQMLFG